MARQANLAVGSVGAMLLSLATLAAPLNVSAAPTETPVYFSAGGHLVAEVRVVESHAPARQALKALTAGPAQAGHHSEVPPDVTVLNLAIKGGVATANFGPELFSSAGTTGLQLRLGQIVYTLTAFPTVTRVQFLANGQRLEVANGDGFIIDHPLSRRDFKDVAPLA